MFKKLRTLLNKMHFWYLLNKYENFFSKAIANGLNALNVGKVIYPTSDDLLDGIHKFGGNQCIEANMVVLQASITCLCRLTLARKKLDIDQLNNALGIYTALDEMLNRYGVDTYQSILDGVSKRK